MWPIPTQKGKLLVWTVEDSGHRHEIWAVPELAIRPIDSRVERVIVVAISEKDSARQQQIADLHRYKLFHKLGDGNFLSPNSVIKYRPSIRPSLRILAPSLLLA
jgi:hypothetical protein